MSQPNPLPAVPGSPPNSSGVRRHHTISASSRTARTGSAISEEAPQDWNEDEVVDGDWVGGVGAVGEKSSLHRQSSLPTRYHRGALTLTWIRPAFQPQASGLSRSGSLTPNTKNSLTAIAGHEGDEDDWEGDIDAYGVEDEHPPEALDPMDPNSNSPLSPHDGGPSPPPAASSVRRHVSLTYGAAARQAQKIPVSSLRRSGTLQTPLPSSTHQQGATATDAAAADYEYDAYEGEDAYAYQEDPGGEYYAAPVPAPVAPQPKSPIGRLSPWANSSGDWRGVDEMQRALAGLELGAGAAGPGAGVGGGGYGGNSGVSVGGQSAHPPRFNPTHPPPAQQPGMRNVGGNTNNGKGGPGGGGNGNGNGNGGNGNGGGNGKLQLVTDFDGRKTPLAQPGPASAGYQQFLQSQQGQGGAGGNNENARVLGLRTSNPNLQQQYGYQGGKGAPPMPALPQQYLQQQQGGVGVGQGMGQGGQGGMGQGQGGRVPSGQTPTQGPFVNTPVDVPSLIASKGYNPVNFDLRPGFARYFVIKSYTEDDVHKSLKYEIWSSTEPGNKRLDKAFKECGGRGPIYLFFSVNASGHFCGMAEMLTPVDYTRSSTVWASDKWKGVFKVRWVFVRDIPNVNLRHIKLLNTTERKPVTNSRDTQELLAEAGQEMLRIFHTHPARTSLLQDFAFYELQAMQKMQGQGQGTTGPSSPSSPTSGPGSGSSVHSSVHAHSPQVSPPMAHQQPAQYGAMGMQVQGNPNALAYQMPQMTPMMQMQMMGMGFGGGWACRAGCRGGGGGQYGVQAMHQSVMRHPSPAPPGSGGDGQGFGGF
ncbi:YTH-domain-containing protein [Mycena leptocephala]|nr:YTH-domain-containing protein [Mycena leptocephala]